MSGHWFSWFPGDYMRDTAHLSMIEDAAYRRLLDSYYMTGKLSANAEVLLRVCRAVTADEQEAVRKVAAEYFEVRAGYLFQEKVEQVIAKSRAVAEKRSEAGRRGAAKTNGKKSALAAANDAAKASTIPQPHVNLPTSSGTVVPHDSDPIFGHGLEFLKEKGVTERSARSFLGLLRKECGDQLVVEAIAKAESDDITDPVPWFRQYVASRKAGRQPAPENFANRDYGTGGRL